MERSWDSCIKPAGSMGTPEAAAQVTPSNVEAYIAELTDDVGSVTVTGYISGLHRAARLLAPRSVFSWLAEIEQDLKLVMQPRSQIDHLGRTPRPVATRQAP